jgi:peptidoglycan/xylan/chitin deacetylase (PgdA/CDA1 family)
MNPACVAMLCAIAGLAPAGGGGTAGGRNRDSAPILAVFRLDDYSRGSWDRFDGDVVAVFRNHGCPLTIGVIPFLATGDGHDGRPHETAPLAPEDFRFLRQAAESGTVEVALHGWSHQSSGPGRAGGRSEFRGLDLDSQMKRISAGKAFLEAGLETPVTTFIPPWGSYDANTLKVLSRLGFSILSAGNSGPACRPGPEKYLPATCGLGSLKQAVEIARKKRRPHAIVVCLFHANDLRNVDVRGGRPSLSELEDLVAWATCQQDVKVVTLRRAADAADDLGEAVFNSNKARVGTGPSRFLPAFLRPGPEEALIWLPTRSDAATRAWVSVAGFYLLVLLASLAISHAAGRFLLRQSSALKVAAVVAAFAGLLCVSAVSLRDLAVGSRGLMLMTAGVGVCLGVLSAVLKLGRAGRAIAQIP